MQWLAYYSLIVILFGITPTFGFWNAGHMIVARIAYEQIKLKNQFVLHTVEHKIDKLKDFSNESNHTFVE